MTLSCCLFGLGFASAEPEAKDAYPFTGVFGFVEYGVNLWNRQKNACLTSFYTQSESGNYVWYHVDTDRLRDKDELSYVVWEKGRCTWDAGNRIETCLPEFSVHGIEISHSRYLGKDFDDTGVVSSGDKESILTATDPDPEVWQVRCRLDLKSLSRFLSGENTSYDQNAVRRIVWREPDVNTELLNKIREKLGTTASRQTPFPYRYSDRSGPGGYRN